MQNVKTCNPLKMPNWNSIGQETWSPAMVGRHVKTAKQKPNEEELAEVIEEKTTNQV